MTNGSLLPLCSIIIPVYNCEAFIGPAIHSALNQTYKNIEIIVIDDHSTDATFDIICSLKELDSRIKAERNAHNLGVSKTRQIGFALAKGEYIALLDSDDTWTHTKLHVQIAKLEKTHADICCCAYELMDEQSQLIGKRVIPPHAPTFQGLLKHNYIGCSTSVFRRVVSDSVSMRADFAHEDYVFWLECLQRGFSLITVDEPLVQYRLLNSSRSANKFQAAKNRWKVYRSFLDFPFLKSLYYFAWYLFYGVSKQLSKNHC